MEQRALPLLTVHLVTVAGFSSGKDTDWAPEPTWTIWRISWHFRESDPLKYPVV